MTIDTVCEDPSQQPVYYCQQALSCLGYQANYKQTKQLTLMWLKQALPGIGAGLNPA